MYEGKHVGEGNKSYSISFTLLDENKTLTDKVIDKTMKSLIKGYEEQLGAIIRQ